MNARRLPVVTGKSMVRALERAGFTTIRTKGSHHIMKRHESPTRTVIVPVHGNEDLRPGTLREILQQAGLTTDDLLDLL